MNSFHVQFFFVSFFFFSCYQLIKVSRLPLRISPPLAKTSAFSFTRVFLFVNARFFFCYIFPFFFVFLLHNIYYIILFFFLFNIFVIYYFALVLCVSLQFGTIISFLFLFSAKCISSWVAIDEVHCVQFPFFFIFIFFWTPPNWIRVRAKWGLPSVFHTLLHANR